jgi:hypothetical protein
MATDIQVKDPNVIQQYGNPAEVLSLARRIKIMVPGGSKLADAEAQALAQVSLVTKCNPFIGEIWYIPGRGPMIGIKGARRHGNEQVEQAGGRGAYWFPDLQPCSPDDAGAKDVKDVSASFRCVITDSVSTSKYQQMFLETVNSLRSAGSKDPVGEAREICGKRPQWIGYGFSTTSEQSKMNKQALAMKRAEADALKKRFDIPFGTEISTDDSAVESGGPEWIEGTATTSRTEEQNLNELGFDSDPRPETVPDVQMYRYNDATIVARVAKILSYSTKEAAEVMYQSRKSKKIGETLTIEEAEDFARKMIEPK